MALWLVAFVEKKGALFATERCFFSSAAWLEV